MDQEGKFKNKPRKYVQKEIKKILETKLIIVTKS